MLTIVKTYFKFFVALEPTAAPEFVLPLSNVMARAGQKIKLECEVTGLPQPVLVWSHNGKPMKENRDIKVRLVYYLLIILLFMYFYVLFTDNEHYTLLIFLLLTLFILYKYQLMLN